MTGRTHTIACLAGDGVGPELMAEASRALAAVSRAHHFALGEVHLTVGREALLRYGHPLPSVTRNGYRDVDAILAASPNDIALDGVRADLDLCWRVTRVPVGVDGDLVVVGPLGSECQAVAATRAVDIACARRGRLVAVGATQEWRDLVNAEAAQRPGVHVEHLTPGEVLALVSRDPSRLDVVAADEVFVGAVTDAAAVLNDSQRGVACGWLPEDGPGLFAPSAVDESDVAGFGVTDPTAILYAAALMLSEGLGRRPAARTLERAVAGLSAEVDTRSAANTVIASLQNTRTDTELFVEARA
jgi:isocitrate/isopropylmalate dehydrogenase